MTVVLSIGGCSSDDEKSSPPITTESQGSETSGVVGDAGSDTGGEDTASSSGGDDTTSSSGGDDTETETETETTSGGESGTETTQGDGSTTGTDTGAGPRSCAELECSGFSECVEGQGGAQCVCDFGFVEDARGVCVTDQSCIEVFSIREKDQCRRLADGLPGVSTAFAVEFCSGEAVTPALFSSLGLEFRILEDGVDVADNEEAAATTIPRGVETYVTLAIDMSGSVAQKEDLPQLIASIRALVGSLEPSVDEAPVYVSISLFARTVREYVPFTTDFAALDTALAELESTAEAQSTSLGPQGTALYSAAEQAVASTERVRELRHSVSDDGVITTGAVVLITDGEENTGARLPALDTLAGTQLITIGISSDVSSETLEELGKGGSFLAPTALEWPAAFDAVATRVDEYSDRVYLLAYCTTAQVGVHDVAVEVFSERVVSQTQATCSFDADDFSSDPLDACSLGFFEQECDTLQCGGLTACGACGDAQCCSAEGQCQDGSTAADVEGVSCDGDDSMCGAGQRCDDAGACVAAVALGEACSPGECEPGVGFCGDGGLCEPTLPQGGECVSPVQCSTLSCIPDNLSFVCGPPAQLGDSCTDGSVCEAGTYCDGSACTLKKDALEPCSRDQECDSGRCIAVGDSSLCDEPAACFWTWDDKLGG